MADILIRPAVEGEEATIASLIGQLRTSEGLEGRPPESEVSAFLTETDTAVLLAEIDGEAVGALSLRFMRDLFHGGRAAIVMELVVDEGHRRRGVAKALLDEAIRTAERERCVEMGVTTGLENHAGQAAYESRGFRKDGLYYERHLR